MTLAIDKAIAKVRVCGQRMGSGHLHRPQVRCKRMEDGRMRSRPIRLSDKNPLVTVPPKETRRFVIVSIRGRKAKQKSRYHERL